ncbi:hypothetical protein Ssi02_15840 [Sinosporangium siamense]|uniref:Lanthionine synthetase C-like protein n=1 Tax=Sinosporangium siamense TaxID=1367973 RepID=A0A919V5A3_9ACTN|nr:hypothetical protein Ssi02_15840 [Sinosporangium siamense]
MHIERAHNGTGAWHQIHSALTGITRHALMATTDASLFVGAPAVAFVLHTADAGTGRYAAPLQALDGQIADLTQVRLDRAHARIDRRERPRVAEFDLLYGLTGLGTYLLLRNPTGRLLRDVLEYLVRLTEPLPGDPDRLPGWWTEHGPRGGISADFPGGHANLGMAHGISGPLALMARALRCGVSVGGQAEGVNGICAWLDTWRHDGPSGTGSWWPQWITREEVAAGRSHQQGPLRLSWCYGTPGLARAQQLAALAVGDIQRQDKAEHALAHCLSDRRQLARLTNTGLCHGWAGLFQTSWRAAHDARTSEIGAHLPYLTDHVVAHSRPVHERGCGFLDGDAGLDLALHTAARTTPPVSGWDACLLI